MAVKYEVEHPLYDWEYVTFKSMFPNERGQVLRRLQKQAEVEEVLKKSFPFKVEDEEEDKFF